jgi:hypothetical protein
MDSTAAQFDEEEHIQPLQPDRLDGKEVNGEHASSVRAQELAPRHPTARADGPEARFAKPGAHHRRRNHEPKA